MDMEKRRAYGWSRAGRGCLALAGALLAGTGWLGCSASGASDEADTAQATLMDRSGKAIGEVSLRDTPNGVLLDVSLEGAPPGEHALHIHERGECEPPFASAGGHFAPDGTEHGFLDSRGPHAGDLPNIVVPASGKLRVEVIDSRVRLEDGKAKLLDADGSALVIHQGADDYRSQPAGAAGARIACAVIRPSS